MKVPFFASCKKELIITLIDKLVCHEFNKGDSLMDQGEIGDCMFVIIKGECGVYVFNDEEAQLNPNNVLQAVAIIGENTVVGESAMTDDFENGKRSATIMAHSQVITLKLMKTHYQKILKQHQDDERMARLKYLSMHPFFGKWQREDRYDFNNLSDELKVTKGTTIYDIGQDPGTFYVVRSGKLIMETLIELDSYFKYPVDL